MDFFKKNWGFWLTLAFFAVLTFLNVDNLYLTLLVFLFLFPFTKRGFIFKVLFFLDVIYFMLLAVMVLLSLLVPDAPLFADTLYVGLVVTAWTWIYSFSVTGVLEEDDDDSKKAKIIYFVFLMATPFVCSAISAIAGGVLRTILCWVVGLTTLSSLVGIFGLFRVTKNEGSSSGSKTASLSRVEAAARGAARACYCEVVSVQKSGGGFVIRLANARDSYGWLDVSNRFMESMQRDLSGYDVGNIKIIY